MLAVYLLFFDKEIFKDEKKEIDPADEISVSSVSVDNVEDCDE